MCCGVTYTDLEYILIKDEAIIYARTNQTTVGIFRDGTEWKFSEQPNGIVKEYISQYYQ